MKSSIYHSRLATADQSREIDAFTINELGVSGNALMETAGAKAAKIIREKILSPPQNRVLILSGSGNNGGDGLVIARHLHEAGCLITLCMVNGTDKLSDDCQSNFERIQKLAGIHKDICIVSNPDELSFEDCDLLIDGMLGTGLTAAPRNLIADVIKKANQAACFKIALDIPTGINATTGEAPGDFLMADHTIQFGTRKIGLQFGAGRKASGKQWFCSLGFPLSKAETITRVALDAESILEQPKILAGNHKYQNGIVHIVGGSQGMSGAAVLAAKSAWYAGVGSVQIHIPRGMLPVYDRLLIQQIKKAYGNVDETALNPDMAKHIVDNINPERGILLIGPGLGRAETTIEAVRFLLTNYKGKVVLDADGLFAISNWDTKISDFSVAKLILTPHSGELAGLLPEKFENDYERLLLCEKFSREQSCIIVSKGLPTFITSPDQKTSITTYETTIFGRSGFGDVLAGKIAGYWSLQEDATLAAHQALLHGVHRYHSFKSTSKAHMPDPIHFL